MSAVFDFEIYVLMSMRRRLQLLTKWAAGEAALASYGVTLDEGERIHARVDAALGEEVDFFDNLRNMLGVSDFRSTLWPGFDFHALPNDADGRFRAGYCHVRGEAPVQSPRDVALWSMDIREFARRFGPFTVGRRWPLRDEHLPAYEEHRFVWDGWDHGVGACWGLVVYAARYWD